MGRCEELMYDHDELMVWFQWILNFMADDDWWLIQILIKCPTNTVRQLFYRLVLHVINQLKTGNTRLYPYPM